MADQFAANGYYTLLPDLFDGDAIPLNGSLAVSLMEWLKNGSDGKHPHTSDSVDPIVEKALKYLKEEKGFKKVAAVGYCFVSGVHSRLRGLLISHCLGRQVRCPFLGRG